jgi:hypothetical protein
MRKVGELECGPSHLRVFPKSIPSQSPLQEQELMWEETRKAWNRTLDKASQGEVTYRGD